MSGSFLNMRKPRRCLIVLFGIIFFLMIWPFLSVGLGMALGLPDAFLIFAFLLFEALNLFLIFKYGSALVAVNWQAFIWKTILEARTQYDLPPTYTKEAVRHRAASYGESQVPCADRPLPMNLRYRFKPSKSAFMRGVETVVTTYEVDVLDEMTCGELLSLARRNAEMLWGTAFPDNMTEQQCGAPLQRVCVTVLFAAQVEASFAERLYSYLCEQTEDELYETFMPCVVDEARRVCVFDSLCPETGHFLIKASKTRAVRLIRRSVFDGALCASDTTYALPQAEDEAINNTLWEEFRRCQREFKARRRQRETAPFPEERVQIGRGSCGMRRGDRCIWVDTFNNIWVSLKLCEESGKAVIDSAVRNLMTRSSDSGYRQMDRKAFVKHHDAFRHFFEDRGYTVEIS